MPALVLIVKVVEGEAKIALILPSVQRPRLHNMDWWFSYLQLEFHSEICTTQSLGNLEQFQMKKMAWNPLFSVENDQKDDFFAS